MKTVEERVQEYLSKYVQTFNRQQERELIKLLKEQDRLTREAISNAVYLLNRDVSGECVWLDDVATEITKAV